MEENRIGYMSEWEGVGELESSRGVEKRKIRGEERR